MAINPAMNTRATRLTAPAGSDPYVQNLVNLWQRDSDEARAGNLSRYNSMLDTNTAAQAQLGNMASAGRQRALTALNDSYRQMFAATGQMAANDPAYQREAQRRAAELGRLQMTANRRAMPATVAQNLRGGIIDASAIRMNELDAAAKNRELALRQNYIGQALPVITGYDQQAMQNQANLLNQRVNIYESPTETAPDYATLAGILMNAGSLGASVPTDTNYPSIYQGGQSASPNWMNAYNGNTAGGTTASTGPVAQTGGRGQSPSQANPLQNNPDYQAWVAYVTKGVGNGADPAIARGAQLATANGINADTFKAQSVPAARPASNAAANAAAAQARNNQAMATFTGAGIPRGANPGTQTYQVARYNTASPAAQNIQRNVQQTGATLQYPAQDTSSGGYYGGGQNTTIPDDQQVYRGQYTLYNGQTGKYETVQNPTRQRVLKSQEDLQRARNFYNSVQTNNANQAAANAARAAQPGNATGTPMNRGSEAYNKAYDAASTPLSTPPPTGNQNQVQVTPGLNYTINYNGRPMRVMVQRVDDRGVYAVALDGSTLKGYLPNSAFSK